jgi:beta-N-acetylhexosaminidase
MKEWSLRDKIGQMIVTGYPTADLSPGIIELIEEYKVANIILFSYNLQSIEQVHRNCKELHRRIEESTGYPAFISIDQEGGVVTRLPGEEACNVPGAMLIGATGNKEYAYQAGRITGEELRALGININLAPVLDVNSNPDNPVIGVRSYSSDPEAVKAFGCNMMKGLEDSGIMATVKHFPGHGDTAVDSHLGLPVVEKDLHELMQSELIPFQNAIEQGANCVMSSHILFPKLETEKKPATMSRAVLTGLLREKLGFKGLIITDCLEMSAIKSFYGTANGAVEAVKAGAQLLCISHTPDLVKEAIHRIEAAVEAGEIAVEIIDEAVANILKYKEKYRIDYRRNDTAYIGCPEHKKLVAEMLRSGITKVSDEELPAITENTVFLGSYAYRSTMASSSVDQGLHFGRYMAEQFHCRYLDIPIDPEQEMIEAVLAKLTGCTNVVYGLYNGHLNSGQISLAKAIRQEGHELIAVTLRNPYDFALLDDRTHKIAAYEYNQPVFDALVELLRKEVPAKGKLPVILTK